MARRSNRTTPASAPRGRPARRRRGKNLLNYPRFGKGPVARWWPSLRLFGLGVLVVLGLGVGGFAFGYATTHVPSPNELADAQTSIVYWDDGKTELGRFAAQRRESVPISQIPQSMRQAVIAAEDRTFYQNRGISPVGIARAAWGQVTGNRSAGGGSTITQQYVKNFYLTSDQTLTRKFREWFIALKIDQQQSKDEILANYLNTIYFGRGVYGVQAASQAYFGKDVRDLDVPQAALLAGMIQSPTATDPATARAHAEERWNYVLDGMVGDGAIPASVRATAQFPQVLPAQQNQNYYAGTNGYLLQAVRTWITQNTSYTTDDLDRGGLRITTSFSARAQAAAVAAVDSLPKPQPQGFHVGLVSIDPATGQVKALYGGADYLQRQRNAATQDIAQAGSTFKPFGLVAALENGVTLDSQFSGTTGTRVPGFDKPVTNFGGESLGRISLLTATEQSVNTAYAQLNVQIGPEKTRDAAIRAGLPANTVGLDTNPSNILGPSSPRVIDMASAYATFAAQGVHRNPVMVQRIGYADGKTGYTPPDTSQRVFAEPVMAQATYALTQVVQHGTGTGALALRRPAAGKTGTSSDNMSAWFSGYTPQLATSVAMYQVTPDNNAEKLTGFGGVREITGGTFPVRVWTRYMQGALQGMPVEQFPALPRQTASPAPRATRAPTVAPTTQAPAPQPTVQQPQPTQAPAPQPTQAPVPVQTPAQPPAPPADGGTSGNGGAGGSGGGAGGQGGTGPQSGTGQ